MSQLSDKRVAILATDGFEQSELREPMRVLRELGARIDVVAPDTGTIQGFKHLDRADNTSVDVALADADSGIYDALVVPGGLFSPDALRVDARAMAFVRAFADARKPVAAICHGPWLLADADLVKGRTVTSVANIRRDLERAGAKWVDEAVVSDHGVITSRTPDDLPAFCARVIREIQGMDFYKRARKSAAA